jgi:hypothetical protein
VTDYTPNPSAAAEGDDVPAEPNAEVVRIYLYGDGFASIDGELQMSAFGPNALGTIARKLLAIGYDSDRELALIRGGKRMSRVLLRDAAKGDFE